MNHYPDTELFIGGKWRPAKSGESIPVHDPATHQVLGQVARAGRADMEHAVAAVQGGFERWRRTSAFDRSKLMRKAAEILRGRSERIAWIMTREQGKPLAQSRLEVSAAADTIDWFAEEARRTYGQVIPARREDVVQIAARFPVGPVAAFTPWNFPINQVVRKLSAALAAGCSIIVKGPEETPASPAELIRAFVDAGLPEGVVNLLYGAPAEISEYLIPHPVIRKISFTGSTAVGKHLASLAGLHMKRMTMELGGHAPVLVFKDADLESAVETLIAAKYRNAGQVCAAPTRFLVEDTVFEPFVERFVEAAKAVSVGNGLDPVTQMGPLAKDHHVQLMEQFVADAVSHGAQIRTGGKRIGNIGNFFEPTVLADVPTEARIMNDEPFGPIAIVNRFAEMDEAVSEANRLPYGLAAYAFTGTANIAHKLRTSIEAGMLSINHNGIGLPEVPFGGIKDSGYGSEGGSEAIEAYLETRLSTQSA